MSIRSNGKLIIATLIVGLVLVFVIQPGLSINESGQPSSDSQKDKPSEPLYWVAPMDDNYRRDKPGLSPMGMDLVPVYADTEQQDFGKGAIRIKPHVVNNLGVRVKEVLNAPMISEISTVGYVQFDEDKIVHIHPRVEGWIDTLYVKAQGEPVEKGAPLYTLYSPQLVNAQEEFLIALKRKNKVLIQAARERLGALQLSQSFIKKLEQTRQVRQSIIFTAKQSGVVDNLKVREGFFVKPGTTIMSIGQLDSVWVEAEVFESDSALVDIGLAVTMSLDYLPGCQWQGQVDYVYPTLDPITRTLRVRLKFANEDAVLKPNMFAQISIFASSNTDSLLVPVESVIRTGKQNRVVLGLGDGYFKSVAVTLGRVNREYVEILSGIEVNDSVVVSAQFLLDSESSKNSDFMRMMPEALSSSDDMHNTHDMDMKSTSEDGARTVISSASVKGIVNHIMRENRTVNISREAISKWGRPAATMDFILSENIDIEQIKVGDKVHFTFEVSDDFVITELHILKPSGSGHQASNVVDMETNNKALNDQVVKETELEDDL